jgi:hypothetical protein
MAKSPESSELNLEESFVQMAEDAREQIMQDNFDDPVLLVERVYQIWWHWSEFELYIINPTIDVISPPLLIIPEKVEGSDDYEYVYTIHDHGHKLTTSKSEDMYTAGMSMCKLFYTIEKMIFLLVERLKSGGVDSTIEVQIAFGGHEIAQRKAFESVINLNYNVVVTNFDPGVWGERYLENVKRIADKGYGYPSETPRDGYRQTHGSQKTMSR